MKSSRNTKEKWYRGGTSIFFNMKIELEHESETLYYTRWTLLLRGMYAIGGILEYLNSKVQFR